MKAAVIAKHNSGNPLTTAYPDDLFIVDRARQKRIVYAHVKTHLRELSVMSDHSKQFTLVWSA